MTDCGSLGLSFWIVAKNNPRLSIEPVTKRLCHDCRSVTRTSPSSPRQTSNSLPWKFVPTSRQKPQFHSARARRSPPQRQQAETTSYDTSCPWSDDPTHRHNAAPRGRYPRKSDVGPMGVKTAARVQGTQRPPHLVATTGVFQVNAMPCVILLGRPSTRLARMRRIGSHLGHAIAR